MIIMKMLQRMIGVMMILGLLGGHDWTFAQPASGDWTVKTDFGEFTLAVDSAGTYITSITYNFSSWSCGGVTLSGGVKIGSRPGWPISDNAFTIANTLDIVGNQKMTILGTFAGTGDQASGTWNAVMYGTTCSGSWNIVVHVETVSNGYPQEFALAQNYPNPFNPATTIEFSIPRPSNVTLTVYNIIGEKIETLVSERLPAGKYKTKWSAQNLSSGVYFYRLQAGDFVESKKLLLLR